MIHVHHLEQSRSERILWLLEELELPYEITRYARDPTTRMAPAALRAIHPLGKSPVVVDDGVVLAESGAIVEYFVERYGAGRLAPQPGTPERLRYTYWLHFAEGSFAPPLVMDFLLASAGDAAVARNYVNGQFKVQLDFIERELTRSDWLAGDAFSAADIMIVRHLGVVNSKETSAPRPRIAAYLQRARQRPAYVRAMARAKGDT